MLAGITLKEIMIGMGEGTVVLVGVIIIIKAIKKFLSQKGSEKVESIYVDELNISEIKTWFTDKLPRKTLKGMILYPTPENIAKWQLGDEISRQGNTLIQAVYDEETDKIIAYREVIFDTLSPKLKELLDNNNGALVIEG